ncbi:hypothetical protein LTR95_001887 [Oleoguttula sp. CCFEE 5521]
MPSNAQTMKQHGTVPWTSHTRIGAGCDPSTHEVLASPFFGLNNEDDSDDDDEDARAVDSKQVVSFALHDEVFTDAIRLADYLETWTSGPGPPLSVEQMRELGEYVKSLQCGQGRAVQVVRGTVTEKARQFHDELLLTPQAKAVLSEGGERFREGYGEYCVTGHIRQASLVAISSYGTDEVNGLTRSSTGLSLSSKRSNGEQSGTSNGPSPTGDQRSRKVLVSGIKADDGLAIGQESDLTKAWQHFREKHELMPRVALLEHYSSLLPGQIERPTKNVTLGFDTSSALWRCAVLQMLSHSLTAVSQTTIERLEVIHEKMNTHIKPQESAENAAVEKLGDELDEISISLREMARRSEHKTTLQSQLEALSIKQEPLYPEGQWSHKPFNTSPETVWSFGVTPDTLSSLGISPDIPLSHTKTCVLDDSDRMTTQKPEPLRIEVPGCRIVGAVLKNRYADPRHGGKWARVGGWLGKDTFSVRFETQHFRGCDWELTVWSVSEEMFVKEL